MLSGKAKRRLGVFIRFMRALPRSVNKHFYMGSYISHPGDHKHGKPGESVTRKQLLSCGTTACALGWACQVPSFRRAGLKLIDDEMGGEVRFGRKYSSVESAEEFFDIPYGLATELFQGDTSIETPKQWVRMAERKIKEWDIDE